MTDETILAAVHTWGKENRLNYEAHILDAPPEHLDLSPVLNPENLTVNRSGVCLTVKEPEPTHKTPLSVDIWIPTSGNQGSFLICHEGNAKSKDWFDYLAFTVVDHNEIRKEGLSALVGNLDFIKRDFYQEYVFVPALEAWLEGKGLKYSETEISECSGEAVEITCDDSWFVIDFESPSENYPDATIIAVNGGGVVCTLKDGGDPSADGGFLSIADKHCGLLTGKDLSAWLEKNIILEE